MCGWSIAAWMRPSLRKRSLNEGSIPSCRRGASAPPCGRARAGAPRRPRPCRRDREYLRCGSRRPWCRLQHEATLLRSSAVVNPAHGSSPPVPPPTAWVGGGCGVLAGGVTGAAVAAGGAAVGSGAGVELGVLGLGVALGVAPPDALRRWTAARRAGSAATSPSTVTFTGAVSGTQGQLAPSTPPESRRRLPRPPPLRRHARCRCRPRARRRRCHRRRALARGRSPPVTVQEQRLGLLAPGGRQSVFVVGGLEGADPELKHLADPVWVPSPAPPPVCAGAGGCCGASASRWGSARSPCAPSLRPSSSCGSPCPCRSRGRWRRRGRSAG